MIVLDIRSNLEPCVTAFFMPNGIQIEYIIKNDHNPKLIETGSLSIINSDTDW